MNDSAVILNKKPDESNLLKKACQTVQKLMDLDEKSARTDKEGKRKLEGSSNDNGIKAGIYREVFRHILLSFFKKPIFYMPGHVRLGQGFGLHFFEPRYRLLISDVMEPYPEFTRQGKPITADTLDGYKSFPSFIYAFQEPLKPMSHACLVQVKQCVIHPDKTADVYLEPTAYVKVLKIWERPESGRLFYAQFNYIGKKEREELERKMVASEFRARQARPFLNEEIAELGNNVALIHALREAIARGRAN